MSRLVIVRFRWVNRPHSMGENRDAVGARFSKVNPFVQQPLECEGLFGKREWPARKSTHPAIFAGKSARRIFREGGWVDEEFLNAIHPSDTILQTGVGRKRFGLRGSEGRLQRDQLAQIK